MGEGKEVEAPVGGGHRDRRPLIASVARDRLDGGPEAATPVALPP